MRVLSTKKKKETCPEGSGTGAKNSEYRPNVSTKETCQHFIIKDQGEKLSKGNNKKPLRQKRRWDGGGEREEKMTFRQDLLYIRWFPMPSLSKFTEGSIYIAEMKKNKTSTHSIVENLISSTGHGNVHTNLDKSINSEKEKYNV